MASFMPIHKAEIAFVRILLPFSMGILAVYQLTVPGLLKGLMLTLGLLFICLLILNLGYRQLNIYHRKTIIGILIYSMIFLSGCLHSTLYKQLLYTDYYSFKKYKYLKIRIIDEPEIKPNIILFTALTTKGYGFDSLYGRTNKCLPQSTSGKIRVILKPQPRATLILKYGDELIIPARIAEIEPPGNPSTFDFKSWLAAKNIYHQTFLMQRELVKLSSNTGNQFIAHALQLREKQVALYRKIIKDDNAFAVAATLILGYKSDLNTETLDIYAKTGTIHALSVSGMHVGLIYLVLNWMLSFLDTKRSFKVFKTVLILGLIWGYSLLTGFSPSVLRSAIMISVFIIAKLFAKTTNSYNIIAFAAFCLLLYNPFLIWDIGFQLSFLAVFGLIYLQPKIYGWLSVKNPILDKIWHTTAMSLAAQLATYPLSIYYFHQFPLYFLVSNLFITLPIALIMYLGIFILMFRLTGLGALFEWLINFTNRGLDKIAGLPFSGISAIWISKTELMLLYLTLICFTMAMQGFKKKWLFTSLMLFLVFQSLLTYDKTRALQQKTTIRFKLKRNYALAMVKGNTAIIYTDLQPDSKTFKYQVKPALDQHKVYKVIFLKK
ncbi:ComEC/Rec2 family competence protein [Pedobacter sp. AK017]|uniref:ComEC/Rec2 family competence protein n=1 Tax=Pedobacter sp. AK017 TaxID=2723073 RepID=UPI00295003EA|nr:ComEC/Rec2 family competence protein [Pedobacter sp. AK017]